MWSVYIATSSKGTFYTGLTHNLRRRVQEHKRGGGGFHTNHNPLINVVYTEKCGSRTQAAKREQQIKKWGKAKKAALINNDFDQLKALSKSREKV